MVSYPLGVWIQTGCSIAGNLWTLNLLDHRGPVGRLSELPARPEERGRKLLSIRNVAAIRDVR